ncbi:MAG TPA: hypothetical protein VMU50_02570, partial [Polyangia bacterium]|nr:hypothetical protein [Polyangia bacterium]
TAWLDRRIFFDPAAAGAIVGWMFALSRWRRVSLAGAVLAMLAPVACSNGASGATASMGAAAGDPADAGAAVCSPIAPAPCPDPPPRYADVQGTLQQRCVPCHDGTPDAAWPLQTYVEVAEWEDVVLDDLLRCTMPPADGGITMTDEERTALVTWIGCGYKQ